MRKIATLLLLIIGIKSAHAQDAADNFTVGVLPVTTSSSQYAPYVDRVSALLNQAFTEKKRFTVVDRAKFDQITKERNLQKQEDFIDGLIVEQGKSLGAQYLVSANINSVVSQSGNKEKTGYKTVNNQVVSYKYLVAVVTASVSVSVQTIDVATGSVKISKTLTSFTEIENSTNSQNAIDQAVNKLIGYFNAYTNEVFPVYMKILKIEKLNKKGNKALEVLIKGGSDMNLQKTESSFTNWFAHTSRLEVYENEVMQVDGKDYVRKLPVGKVSIKSSQGDFSICVVNEGEELIKQKMDEGKTLLLRILSY